MSPECIEPGESVLHKGQLFYGYWPAAKLAGLSLSNLSNKRAVEEFWWVQFTLGL